MTSLLPEGLHGHTPAENPAEIDIVHQSRFKRKRNLGPGEDGIPNSRQGSNFRETTRRYVQGKLRRQVLHNSQSG